MAVSKRTRFEVLKRDEYTCRYCRSKDGELTIDHVVPVALGGGDGPENLVAACRDCNAGKSSSTPNDELVRDVDDDAFRWAEARKRAIAKHLDEREIEKRYVHDFIKLWLNRGDMDDLPSDWESSVTRWCTQGIPMELLKDSMSIAWAAGGVWHFDRFRYMAGVLKNKLAKVDELTNELLKEEGNGA